jgi:hypothetical protein
LRLSVALALTLVALGLAGCGGSSAPTPGDIAQNYMTAIGQVNYASACAMLTGPARHALSASVAPHRGCVAIFKRCIHVNPLALKRDQQQLLFAEVLPTITGRHASVAVGGTAVARELKRLTMLHTKKGWQITGPGRDLSRCRALRRRHSRSGRH